MSDRPQNGKGSKPRPTDLERFASNYDQIQWLSKRRRKGRPEQPHAEKTKYNRKQKHKGASDDG